ncbi:MAG: hypothetical protein GY715_20405, partial [Planctomycetes bacterium]|nr:hypothetical protein [Planctomycetota bacterium]
MFKDLRRLVPTRALTTIVAVGALLGPASEANAISEGGAYAPAGWAAAPDLHDPWRVAPCDAYILPVPAFQTVRVSPTARAAAACCLSAAAP